MLLVITRVPSSDLDTRVRDCREPDLGQGSELTTEDREASEPEMFGQELLAEPPRPIWPEPGPSQSPSPESEEQDASHQTSPVQKFQEHTRKEAIELRRCAHHQATRLAF